MWNTLTFLVFKGKGKEIRFWDLVRWGRGVGGGGLHQAADAKCAMCARRSDRSYGGHPCRNAAQVKKGLGVESKSRERLLFFLCTKVHKHGMWRLVRQKMFDILVSLVTKAPIFLTKPISINRCHLIEFFYMWWVVWRDPNGHKDIRTDAPCVLLQPWICARK